MRLDNSLSSITSHRQYPLTWDKTRICEYKAIKRHILCFMMARSTKYFNRLPTINSKQPTKLSDTGFYESI